jgi:hypothetical protein
MDEPGWRRVRKQKPRGRTGHRPPKRACLGHWTTRDGAAASVSPPGTSPSILGTHTTTNRAIAPVNPSESEGRDDHQIDGGTVPDVPSPRCITSRTNTNSRVMRARRKYPRMTGPYPNQIAVPSTANYFTYRIPVRMQWAKNITTSLPIPSNQTEGRYRIQNPRGEPFPFTLPRWASYWHLSTEHQNASGLQSISLSINMLLISRPRPSLCSSLPSWFSALCARSIARVRRWTTTSMSQSPALSAMRS